MTFLIHRVTSCRRSLLQWKLERVISISSFSPVKCLSTVTVTPEKSGIEHVGNLNLAEICATGNPPVKFNFAKDIFDWHTSQRPNDPALWFCNEKNEDRTWSFSEVQHESIKASLVLQRLLKETVQTPFVLTVLPRVPEWWFLHMGAIRTGTIFCPGTTLLTTEDIQYRLDASSAQMIITDEENAEKVERAHQQLQKTSNNNASKNLKKLVVSTNDSARLTGDWLNYAQLVKDIGDSDVSKFQHADTKSGDIAQTFFTSGTTGKPKMVAHTQASYGIGHYETARKIELKQSDLFWNISDPGWAKSSYCTFFAPWIAGCTVFIHQMKRFEAKPVLEALNSKPISKFCAPPTLYKSMVSEPDQSFKFKALEYALGGGEPLNPEVRRAWKDKTGNIDICEGYGQTEFTLLGCDVPGNDKEGSVGKPNGMYTVKIVNESGKEVPRNEEGVIALKIKPTRPVGLFKGYLKQMTADGPVWDEEKNSECFKDDVYLTGDKGYMDDDGYIFFIGRADDIINSSGYRIGPTEVESALQTHPAVVESAAVSSPDKERGEVVKAFIILNEAYKKSDKRELITEIQNHVKSQTAPYKYPRKIEFVESLPKTVSGKILRRELKRQEYEKYKS